MEINDLFNKELKIINIGMDSFSQNLKELEFESVQLDWAPPAGGDQKVLDALKLIM